jgi:Ser/Thr protein kinase RdoA (MazF antagonist)
VELSWAAGDLPGKLEFKHPVSAGLAQALLAALPPALIPSGEKPPPPRGLRPVGATPSGAYRLDLSTGAVFLRVNPRQGQPELEKALADHLARAGARVNPPWWAGLSLDWRGETYRMDVRPLVEGRHFDGGMGDIAAAARSLGQIHAALEGFALAARVEENAARRFRRLEEFRREMAEDLRRGRWGLFREHRAWARENRRWLGEMAERFDPLFHREAGAQCLHGDCHPANLILSGPEPTAVWVDLEESLQVFAHPRWDQAMLVQRFALRDRPEAGEARRRVEEISRHYGRDMTGLAPAMRQLAWLAAAAIACLRLDQGLVTGRAELEKFEYLERQARDLEGHI